MISHLVQVMSQEDGSMPGEGLSALQTVVTFVLIPIAIFLVIAVLSWMSTSPRRRKSRDSVITHIK
jgi:large-conductance mechanosensitive channel